MPSIRDVRAADASAVRRERCWSRRGVAYLIVGLHYREGSLRCIRDDWHEGRHETPTADGDLLW